MILRIFVIFSFCMLLFACKKESRSNGETIFRTGKNKEGIEMQDRNASEKKRSTAARIVTEETGEIFLTAWDQ